jgi:hypothetical protein
MMFKKIGISLVIIVAAFLAYVAVKPADFYISREISINAPVEKIFPYLNNAKLNKDWNPWFDVDPNAKISFSGPEEGVGARTSWEGGDQLGVGSATVFESIPNQSVKIKLEYVKPFTVTQDAEYTVKSTGNQSVVTWGVRGKNNFIQRLVCTFMNMSDMVGKTFEKGLTKLKTQVEK